MSEINVPVFVHGIVLAPHPGSHDEEYAPMEDFLREAIPQLERAIRVEWGHRMQGQDPHDDQLTTDAENWIRANTRHDDIRQDPGQQDHFLAFGDASISRVFTNPIKDNVFTLGLTDAIYYAADGEKTVRTTVYGQILNGLEQYRGDQVVRLHLISHSLGCTVSFDFLYGLFAPPENWPDNTPDFIREREPGDPMREKYEFWRGRAQLGTLVLGSRTDSGSQLALMMMRKQSIVTRLAQREFLDPTVIGVPRQGNVRWKIFYDVDDVLGYPLRRLFGADTPTIHQFQVNTSWNPPEAHSRYWTNAGIKKEIAEMIRANLNVASPLQPVQ